MIALVLFACAASEAPVPTPVEAATAPDPAPVAAEEPAEPPAPAIPASGPFRRELAPGLVLAGYDPPEVPDDGYTRAPADALVGTDPRLFVVTIDPARYEIVYRSVLEDAVHGTVAGRVATASEWARSHDLHVAWNPGMFEPNGEATGYTRAGGFVSQPMVRRNGLYRSFFVAEPGADGAARAAVLDHVPPKGQGTYAAREELPAELLERLDGHGIVSQSLCILRDGEAAYPPRKNQWSELAYGVDAAGNVVVVFSRWPYEMRELGARIAALDLGIRDLIHGEGGPEATLAIRVDGIEWVRVGSYETGFYDDRNDREWGLPAVMGARPR